MQATRQQILDFLRDHGDASVRELGEHLDLTATGVRQHLTILQREGLVGSRELRGKVGRPALVYSLTESGEATYPKSYDQLASALLTAARDTLDDAAFGELLRRAAEPLARPHLARLEGLTAAERVEAACQVLRDQELIADWEEQDGAFLLHERTCPYLEVAQQHRAACDVDVAYIAQLTGMRVELECCRMHGDEGCTYRMVPGQPVPLASDPSLRLPVTSVAASRTSD